jgi:hypothetical protein
MNAPDRRSEPNAELAFRKWPNHAIISARFKCRQPVV